MSNEIIIRYTAHSSMQYEQDSLVVVELQSWGSKKVILGALFNREILSCIFKDLSEMLFHQKLKTLFASILYLE